MLANNPAPPGRGKVSLELPATPDAQVLSLAAALGAHGESVRVDLLLDRSGSVMEDMSSAQLYAATLFSRALESAEQRGAITGYTGVRHPDAELYEFKDAGAPVNPDALRTLPATGGSATPTGVALAHSLAEMRDAFGDGRARRALLIITDGEATDLADTVAAITAAERDGICVFGLAQLHQAFGDGPDTVMRTQFGANWTPFPVEVAGQGEAISAALEAAVSYSLSRARPALRIAPETGSADPFGALLGSRRGL